VPDSLMQTINRASGEFSLIQINVRSFPPRMWEPNARFCVNAADRMYGATGLQPENKW